MTMCPIGWSGRSSRTSVSTGLRDSAWKVSGPTKQVTDGVSVDDDEAMAETNE